MKKAQGLSMNVIIIAAIALIVLVILSVIFIGRMTSFGQESQSCTKLAGDCYSGTACPPGTSTHPSAKCDQGQVCCTQEIS